MLPQCEGDSTISIRMAQAIKFALRKAGILVLKDMEGPVQTYNSLLGLPDDIENPVSVAAVTRKAKISTLVEDFVNYCVSTNTKAVSLYAFIVNDYEILHKQVGDSVTLINPLTFKAAEVVITQEMVDEVIDTIIVRAFFHNDDCKDAITLPNLDVLTGNDGVASTDN